MTSGVCPYHGGWSVSVEAGVCPICARDTAQRRVETADRERDQAWKDLRIVREQLRLATASEALLQRTLDEIEELAANYAIVSTPVPAVTYGFNAVAEDILNWIRGVTVSSPLETASASLLSEKTGPDKYVPAHMLSAAGQTDMLQSSGRQFVIAGSRADYNEFKDTYGLPLPVHVMNTKSLFGRRLATNDRIVIINSHPLDSPLFEAIYSASMDLSEQELRNICMDLDVQPRRGHNRTFLYGGGEYWSRAVTAQRKLWRPIHIEAAAFWNIIQPREDDQVIIPDLIDSETMAGLEICDSLVSFDLSEITEVHVSLS